MEELKLLRKKIDEIDVEIIEKVCLRMDISRKIGKKKKELNLAIKDEPREKTLERRWEELAKLHNLDKEKLIKLLDDILELSRSIQEKV